MGLDFSGNTSFDGGGGMNVTSQIAGLQDLSMPNIDLSGLGYLMKKPQTNSAAWKPQAPSPVQMPSRPSIQYTSGVTPQGVQYRTALNGPTAGQVEFTGGMPERFGGYMGAQPGYPGGGKGGAPLLKLQSSRRSCSNRGSLTLRNCSRRPARSLLKANWQQSGILSLRQRTGCRPLTTRRSGRN